MSGLGGHQQESWVLIHVMRKVEIGKEACKTKEKKKPSRNTMKKEKGMMKLMWSDTTVPGTRLEDTREQEEGSYNSGRTMRCPQATVLGGYRK